VCSRSPRGVERHPRNGHVVNRMVKARPNQTHYLDALREMTPEPRLLKTFELSEFSKQLFFHSLRKRLPLKSEAEIMKTYLERSSKCHNSY
jgi:hypothetical protein